MGLCGCYCSTTSPCSTHCQPLIFKPAVVLMLFHVFLTTPNTVGTGAAPQGQVYAQATTTSSYVTSTGNTAISQNVPIDFTAPTQQWDIGGCVTFA